VGIAHYVAARRQSGSDARIRLVTGQVDVDVDAVALRAGCIHLLEPEGRSAAERIKQIFLADLLVAEYRAPEWSYFRRNERIDSDLHVLDGGGIGMQAQPSCGGRDLPGQLNVVGGQPAWLVSRQADSDALRSQANVDMVVVDGRKLSDCLNQLSASAEGSGPEIRAGGAAAPDGPPVRYASRLIELLARDLISHVT